LEGITDPGPDQDGPGSDEVNFCSVTGKTGAARDQCLAHNRAINQTFRDEATKREPWFHFVPDGWSQTPELDRRFVVPVVDDQEAVKKLEAVPFAELTAADVQRYTGKAAQFAGRKPFLVRALLYYRETGTFHVYAKDQAILVQHDSFGKDTPDETRSAVVVFLSAVPQSVYVDCGLSE
jgi:hypothetical protein